MIEAIDRGNGPKSPQVIKKIQNLAGVNIANPIIRLGFVPLSDCAPLVAAQELGLYRKYGLRVELSRELGWGGIRDKIVHRELEAAQAHAAMPVAVTLGLGCAQCDCLSALVLNLNGNAITLSNDLWRRGVRDGKTLRDEILRARRNKVLTFGAVFPFASHRYLLRRWLAAHGIDPERDVQIVIVPPSQMVANLQAGHLDGFCAGEPWNSVAVQSNVGWIAGTSAQLDPLHPEKVLMVRADFAANRSSEHVALVAALLEACEFCDDSNNHEQLVRWLARPEYVGADESALRRGFAGTMDFGHGVQQATPDFCIFNRRGVNEPSGEKAGWVLDLVRASGLCAEPSAINFAFGRKIFRSDIYGLAVALRRKGASSTWVGVKPDPEPVPA